MPDSPPKMRFEFIKSPLFRVIHVDGVFGGLTPQGKLFVSFYNERFPIPTAMTSEISPSGELGEEIRSAREGRKGILREVEVGLRFDIDTAKAVVKWLQGKIDEAEKLTNPNAASGKKPKD